MSRRSRPDQRIVNGIVLLDKPAGLSSNQALQRARHALNARKAGHTGSLDPFATGMLPLCFGEATKFSQFLLDADKEYMALAQLGYSSTTGDPEGELGEKQAVPALTNARIAEVLRQFTGAIEQMPPMYSALKHQGRRLYELAREGLEVERPLRKVQIHELRLEQAGDDWLKLYVRCSKGTYIRTLVEDIAQALDTAAYTRELRRTAVTPFAGHAMVGLEDGPDALEQSLLPVEAGLVQLPALTLSPEQSRDIQCGKSVAATDADAPLLRLYDPAGQFIGVAECTAESQLKAVRLLSTAPRAG